MYGITVYLLRILCESEWKGGGGYSPVELLHWTPDQIMFRLCHSKMLKRPPGERLAEVSEVESPRLINKDGLVKGRAADGTELWLPLNRNGKSQAQLAAEAAKQTKGRRRRRRGT